MATMLVTGGTGTLGTPTVAALVAAGHRVRVLTRTPRPDHPEHVGGDLLTGAGIDAAVADADVVVHCATTAFDRKGRFGGREVASTRVLVDALTRRATPPHLVYISIVGIDKVPMAYYRKKLACEIVIAESDVPWTILRATQFHSLIATFVSLPLPVAVLPAHSSFQPIDVRDVAVRLTELAAAPPAGRVPDIGGPEVLPLTELARTYQAARHRRRPIVAVPLPGRIGAGLRAGALTVPENPYGHITFASWLADENGSR